MNTGNHFLCTTLCTLSLFFRLLGFHLNSRLMSVIVASSSPTLSLMLLFSNFIYLYSYSYKALNLLVRTNPNLLEGVAVVLIYLKLESLFYYSMIRSRSAISTAHDFMQSTAHARVLFHLRCATDRDQQHFRGLQNLHDCNFNHVKLLAESIASAVWVNSRIAWRSWCVLQVYA